MTETTTDMRDAVRWSYRLFLEREPENEQVVTQKLAIPDVHALRNEFMKAEEFRGRVGHIALATPLQSPSPTIERISDDKKRRELVDTALDALDAIFAKATTWKDDYRLAYLPPEANGSKTAFFEAGNMYVSVLAQYAARFFDDGGKPVDVLELGAGAGSSTAELCRTYSSVDAVVESESMLPILSESVPPAHADKLSTQNLHEFVNGSKKSYQIFLSTLTLQMLPPPVIEMVLAAALDRLAPGGLAMFQVPTFLEGYQFEAEDYVKTAAETIEPLHCIEQDVVFNVMSKAGCEVCAVREDTIAPHTTAMISNLFVARKAA